jgi:hypothetical protein
MLVITIWGAVSMACAIPGLSSEQPISNDTTPLVTISSPSTDQKIELGSEVEILSTAVDAAGIVRTELVVDGQVIWVDGNADPQPNTPFIVAQPWTPDVAGSHVIQVKAYNMSNLTGQSEPLAVEVLAASAQTVDDRSPSDTVEPTPSLATNTPVSVLQNAPTATVEPSPTPTQVSATPTPTIPLPTPSATPTPGSFAATGLEPEGRFKDIWEELDAGSSRLGYPLGLEIADQSFARQYFEKGMMYWWDNPDGDDYIWVIDSPEPDLKRGATWNRYPDEWDGDAEYACDEARANAEKGPVRGFGWLWCKRPELQARLGNPREREAGSGSNPPYGHVQFYQGGVMLYDPINGEVFVLFDQGDWQRFGW